MNSNSTHISKMAIAFLAAFFLCVDGMIHIPIGGGFSVMPWHVIFFLVVPYSVLLIVRDLCGPCSLNSVLLIIYMTATCLSALANQTLEYEGIRTIVGSMFFVAIVAVLVLGDDRLVTGAWRGLAIGLVVVLIVGLLESTGLMKFPGAADDLRAGLDSLRPDIREWASLAPTAGWGNPNNFSIVITVFLLMAAASGSLLFVGVVLPAIGYVILHTGSDMGGIFILMSIPLFLVSCLAKNAWGLISSCLVLGLALGWAWLPSLIGALRDLSSRLAEVLAGEDARIELLRLWWRAFSQEPWLGYGPGNAYRSMVAAGYRWPTEIVSDVHNQFATVFLELGTLGGLAFTALLLRPVTRVVTRMARFGPNTVFQTWRSRCVVAWAVSIPALVMVASNSLMVWPLWIALGLAIRSVNFHGDEQAHNCVRLR